MLNASLGNALRMLTRPSTNILAHSQDEHWKAFLNNQSIGTWILYVLNTLKSQTIIRSTESNYNFVKFSDIHKTAEFEEFSYMPHWKIFSIRFAKLFDLGNAKILTVTLVNASNCLFTKKDIRYVDSRVASWYFPPSSLIPSDRLPLQRVTPLLPLHRNTIACLPSVASALWPFSIEGLPCKKPRLQLGKWSSSWSVTRHCFVSTINTLWRSAAVRILWLN